MRQTDQNLNKSARKALWRSEKNELGRVYADQARKLKDDRALGKRRHTVQRDFLRNPKMKRAAIVKAFKGRVGRETSHTLAENLDLYAPQEYRIKTYPQLKMSGGSRTICVLPPELAAKHTMIKSALNAELARHPNLFGVKDFGREEAATQIHRLQQAGFNCLWQTDIVDCFASFNMEALSDLPLPEKVKSYALNTRLNHFSFQAFHSKLEAKKGASPETPIGDTPVNCIVQDHVSIGSSTVGLVCNTRGHRGLMQGSPASSAILAWYLNEVLKSLPARDDVQVIVCFDNLLIASRNEDANRTTRNTLADSLGRCSFGPLTLHRPTPSDESHGIDFLGYNHPSDCDRIGISHKSREKLTRQLLRIERDFEEKRDTVVIASTCYELWTVLLDFAHGYSSVTDINAEMAEYIENSSWIPEESDDRSLIHIHRQLFSDNGTLDVGHMKRFLNIMRKRPAQIKDTKTVGSRTSHPPILYGII